MGKHGDDGNRPDKRKEGNEDENQCDEEPSGNLEVLSVLILLSEDKNKEGEKEKKGDRGGPFHEWILDRIKDPRDQNRDECWDHHTEKKTILERFHGISGLAERFSENGRVLQVRGDVFVFLQEKVNARNDVAVKIMFNRNGPQFHLEE